MLTLLLTLSLSLQASEAAESLWAKGERVAAVEMMAKELRATPDDAPLAKRLVQASLDLGRFQSAFEFSASLAEEDRGLRGRALYFLTRFEQALAHLSVEVSEELLMRAECLRALGRFEELEAMHADLVDKLGPKHPEVLLHQARAALRRGDHQGAIPDFRGALEQEPLNTEALFGLGRCLVRFGEREQGLELLERHRLLIPLVDALDFARRGVALAPNHGSNWVALGEALRALLPHDPGQGAECAQAFERGMTLASAAELVPIALRCARFHWESAKDRSKAFEVLESAIRRQPDLRLRVRRADYMVESNQLVEGIAAFEQLAKERPGDRSIAQRLERARAKKGPQ